MNKFKTEYSQINSKSIISEPSYQRMVDFSRVKKIVSNFNPNLVNPIKVSFRDGKYYVFDGQHTLKALVAKNNNRDLMVECKVYYGMTLEDEAKLFAEQNGISRTVESAQKLLSLYIAKDIDVVDFKETVESTGIKCNFRKMGTGENWRIVCYKSLFDIYLKYGKQHLIDLLKLATEIWGGESSSLRKEILIGLNIFITTYKGEYNRKSLVTKLQKVSPITIYRDGKAVLTGGNKRFARIILNVYNRNASTNRLEDKI